MPKIVWPSPFKLILQKFCNLHDHVPLHGTSNFSFFGLTWSTCATLHNKFLCKKIFTDNLATQESSVQDWLKILTWHFVNIIDKVFSVNFSSQSPHIIFWRWQWIWHSSTAKQTYLLVSYRHASYQIILDNFNTSIDKNNVDISKHILRIQKVCSLVHFEDDQNPLLCIIEPNWSKYIVLILIPPRKKLHNKIRGWV